LPGCPPDKSQVQLEGKADRPGRRLQACAFSTSPALGGGTEAP